MVYEKTFYVRKWRVVVQFDPDDKRWGSGYAYWEGRGVHANIMWQGIPFHFSPDCGVECDWEELLPAYLKKALAELG